MRGESERQATMMLGLTPEGLVPKNHPMRRGCCSRKWSRRRVAGGCSRPTTSAWTARCSTPGPQAAGHKSDRPRDEQPPSAGVGRNRPRDPRSSRGQAFTGERRRRETHESTTDPEARLYCKGPQREARLCYLGHLLRENRHGLVVDVELTEADGYAERDAALAMLERSSLPRT